MKVKTLTWWQVLDNWRLDVLGDEGSGAPDALATGSPSPDTPVPRQCRDWLEGLGDFPAVRADLRDWALRGAPMTEAAQTWCARVLVPAIGKGLAVLPPRGLQPPPRKERPQEGGSLRDRGSKR